MRDLEIGLLEWAGRQSMWQQDTLRRLAAGEKLGSAGYRMYADEAKRAELQKTACWYSALEFGEVLDFKPLDATHLTATVAGGNPVQIARIVHLQGANNLAPGQVLEFSEIVTSAIGLASSAASQQGNRDRKYRTTQTIFL